MNQNTPSPGIIAAQAALDEEHRNRLAAQRSWNEADETSMIRVKKAFTQFENFSERHAGALTMAWAILKTIRGG